jgi:hypothetical protein
MVDMVKAESLIDEYVKRWNRPAFWGIFEDNDFGFEELQLIRNGFSFVDFTHDELSKLAVLLTKELKGQINWDHKFFWSYCYFLTIYLYPQIDLFRNYDWRQAFADLINLVLSGKKVDKWREAGHTNAYSLATQYVNTHLLEVSSSKWGISGPLTFSVLEGLVRRKNKDYVNIDGSIKSNFSVLDANGGKRPYVIGKRLNSVNDSMRCFEQVTVPNRKRPCTCLSEIKSEFCSIYPAPQGSDVYDVIQEWRNDLMHGNQYWLDRVPVLLNLMCLFIVDEIDPAVYDSKRDDLKNHLEWEQKVRDLSGSKAPWDVFPPDL